MLICLVFTSFRSFVTLCVPKHTYFPDGQITDYSIVDEEDDRADKHRYVRDCEKKANELKFVCVCVRMSYLILVGEQRTDV